MNTKLLWGVAALLIVGGGVYFYKQQTPDFNNRVSATADSWSRYTYEGALSFEYPSNWALKEQIGLASKTTESVYLEGDGYKIEFTVNGKGFPNEENTEVGQYVVAGTKAKKLENKYDSGFLLGVGTFCGAWGVSISSPTPSRDISDKILASVKCEK